MGYRKALIQDEGLIAHNTFEKKYSFQSIAKMHMSLQKRLLQLMQQGGVQVSVANSNAKFLENITSRTTIRARDCIVRDLTVRIKPHEGVGESKGAKGNS